MSTAGPDVNGQRDPDAAAAAAALLAHPLRVRMLSAWPEGHRLGARLVALGLDCRLSDAVYHLRVLADGGALELVDDSGAGETRFRPSFVGRRLKLAVEVLAATSRPPAVGRAAAAGVDAELDEQDARQLAETPPPAPLDPHEPPPAVDGAGEQSEAPAATSPPAAGNPRRSKRAEALLQLVRRRPGITVREAGQQFGLVNATGLYGPVGRLVEQGADRQA